MKERVFSLMSYSIEAYKGLVYWLCPWVWIFQSLLKARQTSRCIIKFLFVDNVKFTLNVTWNVHFISFYPFKELSIMLHVFIRPHRINFLFFGLLLEKMDQANEQILNFFLIFCSEILIFWSECFSFGELLWTVFNMRETVLQFMKRATIFSRIIFKLCKFLKLTTTFIAVLYDQNNYSNCCLVTAFGNTKPIA